MARKLSFDKGGDFILETRREVELYLASGRIRVRGRLQLYAKTVVAFAVWGASWVSLIFVRPGVALGLVALGGLVAGTILIGFCVQHDANHGAYFRTRRFNHLMGWTADAMLGISSYAWRVKHNVAHHTYTNVDGYDDYVTQTPFMRLVPTQAPRPWYRLQHLYIWPLYAFMASLGSVLGCVLLYFIARKGGEAYFRRKAETRADVIRHWVERNGFGGMLIAALLPPPTPFKFFVFAAGVFEVPLTSYVSAISLARLIRYFGVGYLAVKYGNDALPFLARHKVQVVIFLVAFVVVSYLASRWILRERPGQGKV